MNKNSQSQLVEDLMSIAKLGSSEVEGLKGTFYFDDLIKLIKDIIKKLEKMMDEELTDAKQHNHKNATMELNNEDATMIIQQKREDNPRV